MCEQSGAPACACWFVSRESFLRSGGGAVIVHDLVAGASDLALDQCAARPLGKNLSAISLLGVQMSHPKLLLTAARRRALNLLAGMPEGCTEAVMMAHGFAIEFLAGLVRDGLASAEPGSARGHDVTMLTITGAGRRALIKF
jgi:hypothetical protein